MDMKMCATSDVAKGWDKIDWNKAEAYVKKLQMRIVKAHQSGKHGKVKSLHIVCQILCVYFLHIICIYNS